ncbi:glycosyltransferase family 4 protein [Ancylobacter sp. 6x-1]|uniref:Glycosyltransferase family 4 protein n=1 Tax=Ancylobacter crimeensis TaxID=2579147 RepID=A0ABT0D9Y6_9HYPH|nr:glycosyltransferase family 4 protein [Ancylobacter crimeensis]MCK0196770.1 glycosyltransferase family 4 protein [Ancylobacter crimeensis]
MPDRSQAHSAEPASGTRPRAAVDLSRIEAIAPNFKRRLSGVTATLERVVPAQGRHIGIATLGPGLSGAFPHLRWLDLVRLWRRPASGRPRIWHARRNVEMLPGILLRDGLRMPLKLVFTSASQRRHTGWTRFLIRRMDAVISTSSATANYLERPSTIIHHGIDTERFRPAPDRAQARAALGLPDLKLIGCFGRIRHQKGTDVFVDALIEVLPARPDWGGVVLGRATGTHEVFLAGLKEKVAAAGLADRILFPGEVATDAIADWYPALDLYVAPQRWEGFGVTPLEAAACGVPVIATLVGAFPEIVSEGRTGRLVPPDNVASMATTMASFMDAAPDQQETMRFAAREEALAEHSIEEEARRINAVYEAVWRA